MIIFERIKWRNFLSTGNAYTTINLNINRSTLIVGENGAGKSTLLDALCFVLYGKPYRKINKPQLINSINGKGLEVEIEFSIGKRQYRIRRGIKPSIFEIYQDGVPINQDAEARDYQEMLERSILKLSFKSFSQIVILGSASFVPFMQLSAANRRDVIEDLLDIQIFSTMNTLLKSKISENKDKLLGIEYEIKSIEDRIELHKEHIQSLKVSNDVIVRQKNEKVEQLRQQNSIDQDTANQYSDTISALVKQITDENKLQKKLVSINTLNSKLDSKYQRLSNDIEFFKDNDKCPTCRQHIDAIHKSEFISKSNTKLYEIESARAKLDKDIEDIEVKLNTISNIQKQIDTYNRKYQATGVEIRTRQKFIDDLIKEVEQIKESNIHIEDNNERLKQLELEYSEANTRKESLAKDKHVLDIGYMLLKDSGIKTKIIKQYVPVMNKLINKYLASMDFFVNFELNENFEETIKSRFRDEFSYESFSEGEKSRIDLALLFTWRAVSKLRNSASTNLLILDEVFDGSLDGQGSDELMKILNTVTNDTNVFVISHKTDQFVEKFSNIIRFQKVKNFSQMVV